MTEAPLRFYRPANGTEGVAFFENWCTNCAKDAAMREGKELDECDDSEVCPIIANSFVGKVKEWVYDAQGFPTCTAFEEYGGEDRRETWQKELDRISGARA